MFHVPSRKKLAIKRVFTIIVSAVLALSALYGWLIPALISANDTGLFMLGLVASCFSGPAVLYVAFTSIRKLIK